MADTPNASSVDRFVANARRLVVIQILLSFVALLAAGAASALIYKAILEQNQAAVAKEAAEDAEKAAEVANSKANAARALADAEIDKNEILLGQNQILRQALMGIGTGDFDSVIEVLQENPDSNTYPLIATAHYLAAPQSGEGKIQRYVSASAALVEAIRINQSEVEAGVENAAHKTSLYLEFAGIQCAATAWSGAASSDVQADNLRMSMALIDVPEAVSLEVSQNMQFEAHPIVRKECSASLLPIAADGLGLDRMDADRISPTPITVENFKIERAFMHIADEASRPLAKSIASKVAGRSSLKFPGTERVVASPSAYRASVRYYYAEQQEQAESIQAEVIAAGNELGAKWGEESLPLVKLNIPDLPRERIEVWLPPSGSSNTSGQAVAASKLSSINVVYVQRADDGLAVVGVLEQLVPETNVKIDNPQISGDRNDALGCNPKLSGDALTQFKVLANALIADGVPIRRISPFRNPDAKPASQIEIFHSSAATGPILTPAEIDALTACQIVG